MNELIEEIIRAAARDFWARGRWIWAKSDVRTAARELMEAS